MSYPKPDYTAYENKQMDQTILTSEVSHQIAALQFDYPLYPY